jgi:hypothetical protein
MLEARQDISPTPHLGIITALLSKRRITPQTLIYALSKLLTPNNSPNLLKYPDCLSYLCFFFFLNSFYYYFPLSALSVGVQTNLLSNSKLFTSVSEEGGMWGGTYTKMIDNSHGWVGSL